MGAKTNITYRIDPDSPVSVRSHPYGSLADFYRDHPEIGIAADFYPGVTDIHKFGHAGSVPATLATLWNENNIYVYRTTATVMQVSSSDTDDTNGGAGAWTVMIEGLDGNYNPLMEVVTLNGQTQVATVGLFLRVFRMRALTGGASLWNEGIIYCGTGAPSSGKPAVVHGLIEQFEGQSLMAFYTIPKGHTGYVSQTFITSAIAKAVNGGLYARIPGELFQVKEHLSVVEGEAALVHTVSDKYVEKTDLEMRAKAAGAGGDVSGQFEVILVKNAA